MSETSAEYTRLFTEALRSMADVHVTMLRRASAAKAEALEQARLLGMSAERELALRAKLEAAEARVKELEAQASSFEAVMAELVRRHGETHDRLCAVIDAARQQGGAK